MEQAEGAFDAASDRFDAAERVPDAAREDRAQARRDRYAARQAYERPRSPPSGCSGAWPICPAGWTDGRG
jgi:hypothetical protein